MWLKVPTDFCHYISIASHYGFQFHHTQPKYIMMYLWLPEDVPDKVPAYGTHHLGVAGAFAELHNNCSSSRGSNNKQQDAVSQVSTTMAENSNSGMNPTPLRSPPSGPIPITILPSM